MKAIKRRWVFIYYLLLIGAILSIAGGGLIVGLSIMGIALIIVFVKCRCPYCKSGEVTRHLTLYNSGYHCPKCGEEIVYEGW